MKEINQSAVCPHLNCLVYHNGHPCTCDMRRYCSQCKGEFANDKNPEDNQLENKDICKVCGEPRKNMSGLGGKNMLVHLHPEDCPRFEEDKDWREEFRRSWLCTFNSYGEEDRYFYQELVDYVQSILDKQAEKLLKNERMRGGRLSMEAYRNGYNDAKKVLTNNNE